MHVIIYVVQSVLAISYHLVIMTTRFRTARKEEIVDKAGNNGAVSKVVSVSVN